MPPHRLYLKLFATVILLRNLDPDEGLCNGTRLIIRAFSNRVIDAEIATGIHKQKRVFIPEWTMGRWVMGHGSDGSPKSMGQMGHGSRLRDP